MGQMCEECAGIYNGMAVFEREGVINVQVFVMGMAVFKEMGDV